MNNNFYLNIFFALIILLFGNYYSFIATDFWTGRIIWLTTTIVSGFILIGFDFKKFPKKQKTRISIIHIIAIIIGFSGMFLINYYVPTFIYNLLDWQIEPQFQPSGNELVRFISIAVVWVFIEEIYHRRIIAQQLNNQIGITKAIWISAVIFSITHLFSNTGLLSALFGGLILGYVYLKTHSILLSIFAHLYYNFLSLISSPKITEHISDNITRTKIIGMIVLGLALIIIMVFLIQYLTKKQNEPYKASGQHRR